MSDLSKGDLVRFNYHSQPTQEREAHHARTGTPSVASRYGDAVGRVVSVNVADHRVRVKFPAGEWDAPREGFELVARAGTQQSVVIGHDLINRYEFDFSSPAGLTALISAAAHKLASLGKTP